MNPMNKLLVRRLIAAPAGEGSYPEGTFRELGKPRRIVGAPASKINSYHLKRRRLKRHIGATLGALLIPLVFSGWAFATHQSFAPNEDWTQGPYYGTRKTFFADVTGDGKADAIVVNDNTVTVRRSDGRRFGPNEDWTRRFSNRLTGWNFFADVTGDGRADFIRIHDTITVRRSVVLPDGRFGFGPEEDWSRGLYGGALGTFFADVTGDGRADAIAVDYNTVTVREAYSSPTDPNSYGFSSPRDWTQGSYYGARGTFFADVTGEGAADIIVVNYDKVSVRESTGFPPFDRTSRNWTSEPYYGPQGPPYYGALGAFFADVTGDGTAAAIVVDYNTVTVRRSRVADPFGEARARCGY